MHVQKLIVLTCIYKEVTISMLSACMVLSIFTAFLILLGPTTHTTILPDSTTLMHMTDSSYTSSLQGITTQKVDDIITDNVTTEDSRSPDQTSTQGRSTTQETSNNNSTATILSIVFSLALIVIVIVIGIMVLLKLSRKAKCKHRSESTGESNQLLLFVDQSDTQQDELEESYYYT